MDEINNLMQGFSVAMTLPNLAYMLIGITLGILIGVLPGLGGANGIAILLPLTFSMNPTSAVIMLSCIYWGALFGGAITSILFNIPGEPWSVATTFDGYPMAQQGRAAQALTAAFTSSFVGALIAVALITFLAPLLAKFALRFGPAEYFAVQLLTFCSAQVCLKVLYKSSHQTHLVKLCRRCCRLVLYANCHLQAAREWVLCCLHRQQRRL